MEETEFGIKWQVTANDLIEISDVDHVDNLSREDLIAMCNKMGISGDELAE